MLASPLLVPRHHGLPRFPRESIAFLVVTLAAAFATAATRQRVTVLVVDQSGAPIRGARIVIPSVQAPTETGRDGQAIVALPGATPVDATISADHFSDAVIRLDTTPGPPRRVVLVPTGVTDEVVVRATSTPEAPASTTTLPAATLLTFAAGALDDALRNTPGFDLFRRSSSRTANPTTQGVTLRGVSGSGASRTLVLVDGLPLNDPFGSWVYWNRVPAAAIERVEVQRGPGGDVWGDQALGGVIQVVTFEPTHSLARLFVDGGERGTLDGSGYGGIEHRGWTAFAAAERTATDGAPTIAPSARGPVDVPAFAAARTASANVGWGPGLWRFELRGAGYREHRGNGTPAQVNDTTWRQLAASARGPFLGGLWEARASGGRQDYFQTFTSISPDRTSERMASEQRVPTQFRRASARWARELGGRGLLTTGVEWRRTSATVAETDFPAQGAELTPVLTGGTERLASGFVRADVGLSSDWTMAAGARAERWRTAPGDPRQPRHDGSSFSPQASLTWRRGGTSAHVIVSRATRVPTLNELYRDFRAGNVITRANSSLDPERLTSVEAGTVAQRRNWSLRTAVFASALDGAIANLTIASTPRLIVRQRGNSDSIHALGVESEADWRVRSSLVLGAHLALTRSRFAGSLATPALVGNLVPQTPVVSGGAVLTWIAPNRVTVSVQARASGRSFDDDLNTLVLRRYGVVDFFAGRSMTRTVNAFVAVENVLNEEMDVARTPVRSIGWPRTARVGIRVFFP